MSERNLTSIEPDLQFLVERFQQLRTIYLSAFSRSSQCDTTDERRCVAQELRAITDEAKSITREYRETFKIKAKHLPSGSWIIPSALPTRSACSREPVVNTTPGASESRLVY